MLRICDHPDCTTLTLGPFCVTHDPPLAAEPYPRGRPFPRSKPRTLAIDARPGAAGSRRSRPRSGPYPSGVGARARAGLRGAAALAVDRAPALRPEPRRARRQQALCRWSGRASSARCGRQAAHRAERHVGRLRRDHLPLPVVSLQRRRRRLPLRPRRDLAHLLARQQGHRQDARPDRLRDRLDRNRVGVLEPVGPIAPTPAAARVDGPAGRHRAAGRRARSIQVTTGTWSPTPPTLAYRWERCNANARACAAIANATTSSYTVASADLGHALLAIVQATNGTTIQNAFSTATPAVVAARGPRPAADRRARPSTAPRSRGSSSARRPGSGRASARSCSRFGWYRCDPAGAHCSRSPARRRTSTRSGARTSARRSASTLTAADSIGKTTAYASLDRPGRGRPTRRSTPTPLPTISGTARVGGALDVDTGQWSATPRSVRLHVAALQPERPSLHGDRGRDRRLVPADGRRRRAHDRGRGHGERAGRRSQSALTAATAPIVEA